MQAVSRRLSSFSFSYTSSWSQNVVPRLSQIRLSTTMSTTSSGNTTSTLPPTELNATGGKDILKIPEDEDYRTQLKPVYKLPYYGAGDRLIEALSDAQAKEALKMYGGLLRKDDTGDDWRERLRKVTKSWHLPKTLTIEGVVVSNKMVKSVVVAARRRAFHPILQLTYFKTRRFMAHDELNLCREGDRVVIRSCRPLSKRKAHVVVVNYGDKMSIVPEDRKIVLKEGSPYHNAQGPAESDTIIDTETDDESDKTLTDTDVADRKTENSGQNER